MSRAAQSLLQVAASERYTRQIVSRGLGAASTGAAAGVASINVAWPPAGAVAANVITLLQVALKPGTANGGAVATPAGWTLVGSHIGGGYGGTLADGTGNARIYLFSKAGDNTAAGSLSVGLTPDGANGVAAACMQRIEKLSGSWRPVVVATAEATVNTNAGTFNPTMLVTPGDWLIYAWALTDAFTGTSLLNAGAGLTAVTPTLAMGPSSTNGFDVGLVGTARRALRGLAQIPAQVLTMPGGADVCRGPLVVARYRVR